MAFHVRGNVFGGGSVPLTGCACAAQAHVGNLVFAKSIKGSRSKPKYNSYIERKTAL